MLYNRGDHNKGLTVLDDTVVQRSFVIHTFLFICFDGSECGKNALYMNFFSVCFDDSECGKNAECCEGHCRCKQGFFGNPHVTCEGR